MIYRRQTDQPLVVGHRGSAGTAPENTLASFHLAFADGVNMVELDCRMTRDFFLVVLHDQDIKRTTVGGNGKVWEYSLQELRAFDAGAWFAQEFKGERIPTLRQVMEILPPHVTLNIEMKTDGEPRERLAVEEACILAIMEKKLEKRTLVSSFDHKVVERIHKLYPPIKTGALYLPVRDAGKKPSTMARRMGVSAFICGKKFLTKRMVQDAHDHGITVGCYTVNNQKELSRALSLGVDAVISDHPGMIVDLLKAG